MAFVSKPRQTPQHKKRKALHHRQSKTYNKAYHPYLTVMFLILGLGLIFNGMWSHNAKVLGAYTNFTSTKLVSDTNEQRQKNSLATLTLDPALTTAAQNKADDMIRRNYWSHTTPDSKAFSTFITESGYQYQAAGENLAYGFGSADQVISGWMNSPEHRDNILSKDYQNVGFGVASSTDYLGKGPAVVVVAEYGTPSAAVANVTFHVDNPSGVVKGDRVEGATSKVSRIQLLTGGNATWSMALISAIAGAAIMLFLVRHGFRIHKMISKGEQFMVKHPWLDVSFVFLATAGFLLTRTGGIIH